MQTKSHPRKLLYMQDTNFRSTLLTFLLALQWRYKLFPLDNVIMIVNIGTILGSIYAETTVKFHSDQTTPNPYFLALIFRVIWCWDALLLSKYGLSSNAVFHVGHVVYNSTVPIISMDSVSLYPGIDITASCDITATHVTSWQQTPRVDTLIHS